MKKLFFFSIILISLVGTNCNAEAEFSTIENSVSPQKVLLGSLKKKDHCIELYRYKDENTDILRKEIFFKNGETLDEQVLDKMNSYERNLFIQEIQEIVELYNTHITINEIDSNKSCYFRKFKETY